MTISKAFLFLQYQTAYNLLKLGQLTWLGKPFYVLMKFNAFSSSQGERNSIKNSRAKPSTVVGYWNCFWLEVIFNHFFHFVSRRNLENNRSKKIMKVWMGGGEGEEENCLHVYDFLAELSLSEQPEACKPKGTCRWRAKGTGNAGQLQVVVLSVRPLLAFLSVGHVPFFFFLSFSALLLHFFFSFFFATSCSSFAMQDEWAFEWMPGWMVGTMGSPFNGRWKLSWKCPSGLESNQSIFRQCVKLITFSWIFCFSHSSSNFTELYIYI